MDRYAHLPDDELIRRIRLGEREITDYLMDKYKYLVRKKAKAMYLIGGDNDDLIQEGMIGLFKAIRDYDPQKENAFFAFADLCISRQLYTAVSASQRKKHSPLNSYVSFYAEEHSEQERGIPLLEILESMSDKNPEELVIDRENVADLKKKLYHNLSGMEKEVLKYYLEGVSYIQIGEILGKSPKSVDNALQRVKHKLSAILQREG